LAIGSINGYIYLYDLKRDQSIPFVSFLAVSRKGASIVSINFNNNGQQIAVSDSLGRVVLWQLSTYLSKSQQGEHQALEKLFDKS
jgi:WD40 repeat protein